MRDTVVFVLLYSYPIVRFYQFIIKNQINKKTKHVALSALFRGHRATSFHPAIETVGFQGKEKHPPQGRAFGKVAHEEV
jgi:hypothetical protein